MKTLFGLLVVLLGAITASSQIPYPNPINHVIIIDQENRTIDNLLGSNSPANQYYLPGLNVATSGQAYTLVAGKKSVFTVQSVSLPMASAAGSAGSIAADDYDPGHSHQLWGTACDAPIITDPANDCLMDGFNHVTVTCDIGVTGCPGPAYPTYAYVQYKDVRLIFRWRRSMGMQITCSRRTRGRACRRTSLFLEERRSRGMVRSRIGSSRKTQTIL